MPKLPGSRTLSSASARPPGSSAGLSSFGILTTASTGDGVAHSEMRSIAEAPMSSARSTLITLNEEAIASATIFSPSTTNSPSASRNFFSRSERMDFISALVSIMANIRKLAHF